MSCPDLGSNMKPDEAVLQVTQLHTLKEPDSSALGWLRDWLLDEKGGNKFLDGVEATAWTPEHENDLFSLATRQGEGDHFTRWIEGSVLDFLHRHLLYRVMVCFFTARYAQSLG